MRVYNRPYDERANDFEKMWKFNIKDYADKHDKHYWTNGRLGDWKFGIWNENKFFDSFKRNNAQLWFNYFDELIGIAISEGCDSNFSVIVKRGHEFLYNEILNWVITNWQNRGTLNTEVHEFQESYLKSLEKFNFINEGVCAITRQYDVAAKALEGNKLEEGFYIDDIVDHFDIDGRAILYKNAWQNSKEVTSLDIKRYTYNREHPCNFPKFDISLVNKDGVHVSSCVAFIDYDNNYAEIEKICTHNDFRHKGYAETIIRECFIRLHEDGIKVAYITGYSDAAKNLYEKLGATKTKTWYNYVLSKK